MASDTRSFSLLPPVSIRAESRVDRRRSRTFPRCSRKSAEYPETDANALMRHLHPRDVTKICRVSLGHYCVYACGADISRAGKEQEEQVEARVSNRGGWTGGEQERVIARWRTHQRVSTAPCSCARSCARGLVGQGSSTKPSRPTDRELKIRVRIEMGPILIHIRVSMCAHHSVQQPCVSSWEKSVIDHLSKAIYFSDHLPKAKGAGSFDPALRDRFFEMTPPVKDIRIPCRSFVHVCDMYTWLLSLSIIASSNGFPLRIIYICREW